MAVLTSRSTGIVTGSIVSACASNSAATSAAAFSVGSASNALPGVRTDLPSRWTANAFSTGTTEAAV